MDSCRNLPVFCSEYEQISRQNRQNLILNSNESSSSSHSSDHLQQTYQQTSQASQPVSEQHTPHGTYQQHGHQHGYQHGYRQPGYQRGYQHGFQQHGYRQHYMNQTSLFNQFSTIPLGKFKGLKDTRRLRCYRRECRFRNFQSCPYCNTLPYFPSPLRQSSYPQDLVGYYDFGHDCEGSETDSDIEMMEESCTKRQSNNRTSDEQTLENGNENDVSSNEGSSFFPVEIRLNYLLTEIDQVITTNENELNMPVKVQENSQSNKEHLKTKDQRSTPTLVLESAKSSKRLEIFNKLGIMWKSRK